MQVKNVMTQSCEFIEPNCTLQQAAQKMRDLDCGFLAIGSRDQDKLQGVITDRDIVVRAIADGLNPYSDTVDSVETPKVLYCFQDDDLESAAKNMREQQVYRLVVLDSPENKRLCGVISLGDILRHNEREIAAEAASGIASEAA